MIKKYFIFILYVYRCFALMYVYVPHLFSALEPEEDIRFPETRVTGGCKPSCGCSDLNLGLLPV